MNPKRWKWHFWVALIYFAISLYMNFDGTPASAIISLFVSGVVWFFLYIFHHIVDEIRLVVIQKRQTHPPIVRDDR